MKGFGLFLLLWATTTAATRLGLRRLEEPVEDSSEEKILYGAIVAGGWNGVAVFMGLVVAGAAAAAGHASSASPVLLVVAAIGSLFAFVIGGFIGFAYGLVDVGLLRLGDVLFDWSAR